MPAPPWEKLTDFLRADEFGAQIVVSLKGGGTLTFVAIFDDPFLDAQLGEYALETSEPRITTNAADLPGVARGDTAMIAGRAYDVLSSPQPDGTGMATLRLALQPGGG
jgi:hypothetical protein